MKPISFGSKVRVLWGGDWIRGVVVSSKDGAGTFLNVAIPTDYEKAWNHVVISVGIYSGEVKRGWRDT